MAVSAVCGDAAAARALNAAGMAVVLVGTDGASLGRLAGELASAGLGRVAVFAADAGGTVDLAAAIAMAEEQFGAAAVEVATVAQVADLLSRTERPPEPSA